MRRLALFVISPIVVAAAVIARRMFHRRRALRAAPDPVAAARGSGIADVDPQLLAQPAGEGIDADRVAAAHTEVRRQRERLPVRGGNVP
jgi:hypothetical protein